MSAVWEKDTAKWKGSLAKTTCVNICARAEVQVSPKTQLKNFLVDETKFDKERQPTPRVNLGIRTSIAI